MGHGGGWIWIASLNRASDIRESKDRSKSRVVGWWWKRQACRTTQGSSNPTSKVVDDGCLSQKCSSIFVYVLKEILHVYIYVHTQSLLRNLLYAWQSKSSVLHFCEHLALLIRLMVPCPNLITDLWQVQMLKLTEDVVTTEIGAAQEQIISLQIICPPALQGERCMNKTLKDLYLLYNCSPNVYIWEQPVVRVCNSDWGFFSFCYFETCASMKHNWKLVEFPNLVETVTWESTNHAKCAPNERITPFYSTALIARHPTIVNIEFPVLHIWIDHRYPLFLSRLFQISYCTGLQSHAETYIENHQILYTNISLSCISAMQCLVWC